MLRRDIFNIFFGNATSGTITQETVVSIDTASYLNEKLTKPLIQEFIDVNVDQDISLQVSTAHAFSISWSPASGSISHTSLLLGVLLGLHADTCLYINQVMDGRKLTEAQLSQGFQLKFDCNPKLGKQAYAKLTLTDKDGLTLAMVKHREFETASWDGNIRVMGQHLKYLKIEGRVLI